MKNLPGFYTMLTYSGICMIFKIRRSGIPTFRFQQLQLQLLRLPLQPKCVQARMYSSNHFDEKLLQRGFTLKNSCLMNSSCYCHKNVHFLPSPISCSYHTLHPESSTDFKQHNMMLSPVMFPNKSQEVNDEENDNLMEEENELEKRRELWNVGPGSISSFNFAPFANDSLTLQKLVQMGVAIYKWERMYGIPEFILKLDFQKDIQPYVRFLVDNGVEPDGLGYQLTKNPHILKESIENLQTRLDYLKSKKFTTDEIEMVINGNPYWICFSTRRIDRRLGYFQRTFKLSGPQVRQLACDCPTLITSNLALIKDVTFKIKDEMGFEANEIVTLLLAHPNIWKIHPTKLWLRFDYLHNELKFSHENLTRSPELLMSSVTKMRERVGFLQLLGRAQFDPEKPNFVSADNLINGDDGHFAVQVAKHSVVEFNEYLKTL